MTSNIRPTEIDYLAKDYASFKRLMEDQLALHVPNWQERNAADLGNMLLEVLAYSADQLSYFQDAVATEAYLGTARRVASVKRHARLLDYFVHPGCNSRTWVQVAVTQPTRLPRRTQLLSRRSAADAPRLKYRTPEYDWALQQNPVVFQTMHEAHLEPALNEMRFHVSAEEPRLRRGATRARLVDIDLPRLPFDLSGRRHSRLAALQVGHVLILEETRNPLTGKIAGADPRHRHAVRLTRIVRDVANHPQAIEIEWSAADALPFDLVIAPYREHGQELDVAKARGNIILADHGRITTPERLPEIVARQRYRPYLRHAGVTFRVPYDHERAGGRPAAEAVIQDPGQALGAVWLKELLAADQPIGSDSLDPLNGYTWCVKRDLLSSNRHGRHFLVETTGESRAYLRFGFSEMGKLPRPGDHFAVHYRVGNGAAGNIGPESLATVVTDEAGVAGVRNPLPAVGGTEPESLEHARWSAPHAYRKTLHCVTAEDYARRAEQHASVAEAVARFERYGNHRVASVHVRRRQGRPLDATFRADLTALLRPCRLTGDDFAIRPARLVPLQIGVRVRVEPDHFRQTVARAAAEAMSSQLWDNGRPGFFHPDQFHFGQAVHQSELIRHLMTVRGVKLVDVFRFRRRDRDALTETISIGPLEIATLNFDPDRPEAGDIELIVEGGQ